MQLPSPHLARIDHPLPLVPDAFRDNLRANLPLASYERV